MTPTRKLYDEDSSIKSFTAKVLSVEIVDNLCAVVLDQTAFFPEGGGQPSDRGFIANVSVIDVQIDENGVITHYCDRMIREGTVECEIDYARRFIFMQNHTGEHIVSGVIHSLYGLDNIGFHLSEDGYVTLDFNGDLTRAQLDDVELRANKVIWKNADIRTYYPEKEELKNINYRSKKEIEGDVRIVEIEGSDICACCAPHVKKTGEIGLIKLLGTEKMHGGTRILMRCGKWALYDYRNMFYNVSRISALTSANAEYTAQAVEQLYNRLTEEKQNNSALKRRLITEMIKTADRDLCAVFEDNLDIKELQLFADGLYKSYGGIRGVFSAADGGYRFAICGAPDELDRFFAEFKAKFKVRGGGRGGMVQGSVEADMDKIKLCF